MNTLKELWFRLKLKNIMLSNGQLATEYVMELPKQHREVAAMSILKCIEIGYPLNNMEITCMGRELNRKRLGIA